VDGYFSNKEEARGTPMKTEKKKGKKKAHWGTSLLSVKQNQLKLELYTGKKQREIFGISEKEFPQNPLRLGRGIRG